MALTSSSRGDKKVPTWAILAGLVLLALCIAKASQMPPIPIQGITPSPSATASK